MTERSKNSNWKYKLRFQLDALEAIYPKTPLIKRRIVELKEKLNTRTRKGWRVICPACGHKFYRGSNRTTDIGKEHK